MASEKGGGSQAATVTTEPASFIRENLTKAAGGALDLYENFRPEMFSGSTVIPYSPETELALQAQTARAISGDPLIELARTEAEKTASGGYLDNPYLQPVLDDQYRKIAGGVNSQFAQSGAYGSSANQQALAREQMRAANQANLQNYQQERGNQLAVLGGLPDLANVDYREIGQLAEVGAARENIARQQLADQIARFDFIQNLEPQALDDLIARSTALAGNYNTKTTTEPTAGINPLSVLSSGLNLASKISGAGGLGSIFGGLF